MLNLFGKRQEAKSAGNEASVYEFKILLNLQYNIFCINPLSIITEVCACASVRKNWYSLESSGASIV